ncbi:MAG: pilin [Patescibacteria group bacterium]|nr:pilin [Patescibacteria group bacterium]
MKEKTKNLLQKAFITIPVIRPKTSGSADPETIVKNIIDYALIFIGAVALVFVIYGGVLYVTSGGDAEKTTKARNTILYAILGIIVIVAAYLIVQWAAGSGAETVL